MLYVFPHKFHSKSLQLLKPIDNWSSCDHRRTWIMWRFRGKNVSLILEHLRHVSWYLSLHPQQESSEENLDAIYMNWDAPVQTKIGHNFISWSVLVQHTTSALKQHPSPIISADNLHSRAAYSKSGLGGPQSYSTQRDFTIKKAQRRIDLAQVKVKPGR